MWSTKRKLLYMGAFILIIAGIASVPAYFAFKPHPTCTDGIINQNEEGIDCGGICPLACQASFIPATVQWTKFDESAPGTYNVAAYITNPNFDGYAVNVPYTFKLYDKDGVIIVDRTGTLYIPPHKNTIAFERGLITDKRVPTKAMFSFTETPFWFKQIAVEPDVVVKDILLTDETSSPRVTATIENKSLDTFDNINVYAILYNSDRNVLGFSKTKIDTLTKTSATQVTFTWSSPRKGTVASMEIVPVVTPK